MDNRLIDLLYDLDSDLPPEKSTTKFEQFLAAFGFDRYNLVKIHDQQNLDMRNNLDADFMQRWVDDNWATDDPLMAHSLNATAPTFTGPEFVRHLPTTTTRGNWISEESARCGLQNGIMWPTPAFGGGAMDSLAIFTSLGTMEFQAAIEGWEQTITCGVLSMHLRMGQKEKSSSSTNNLSPRRLELLKWLAHGLQNDQIADKMNISAATVSHHMAGLKKNLGVTHRREILPKALIKGIIH